MKNPKPQVQATFTLIKPTNKADVGKLIQEIGKTRREIDKLNAKMGDEIAKINAKYADKLMTLQAKQDSLSEAVQTWCEANRSSLLDGDSKTANLTAGTVAWRMSKPSVVCKVSPELIARLERFGLERFVRVKKELDKSAILKEPQAVADIEGISVRQGVEDFSITPL